LAGDQEKSANQGKKRGGEGKKEWGSSIEWGKNVPVAGEKSTMDVRAS